MTAKPIGHWRDYVIDRVNPVPWKSPENTIRWINGKPVAQGVQPVVLRQYKRLVAERFRQLHPDVEPTVKGRPIELSFSFWRQLGYRAQRADATNLQKSTEDGLQKVLFENDRDVFRVSSTVVEQSKAVEDLIVVSIREWTAVPYFERPLAPKDPTANAAVSTRPGIEDLDLEGLM